jgi:folate-binding protein YgfZ
MRAALLPERSVIRVAGDDAARFLNNLVTNEVGELAPGSARFAALLTPQGKILFDFFVVACAPEDGGGFVIDAPRVLADALAERLKFYRLRAKVEIAVLTDLAVAVVLDGEPRGDAGLIYADTRHPGLGTRMIFPAADIDTALVDFERVDAGRWQMQRITLGVPEGGKDFVYGDTFPHEADMDALHGVDFDKGCFVGQEVVSRVQHRGGPRKRVVPVTYEDAAPEEGAEIEAGGQTAGFMGSSAAGRGLAMLRLDRVDEALKVGGKIEGGGITLTLVKPDWAEFAFPGEPPGTQ